jgi:hypothetical protein
MSSCGGRDRLSEEQQLYNFFHSAAENKKFFIGRKD